MAATTSIDTIKGEWVALSNGEANVLVEVKDGNHLVQVADVKPANNNEVGHALNPKSMFISFGSLAATNKVWIKSNTANKAIVTK